RRRRALAGVAVARPRLRGEGRWRAAARLAAAGPSDRAEPRLRADVGRHDQARRLRPVAREPRVARAGVAVVGRNADADGRDLGGFWAGLWDRLPRSARSPLPLLARAHRHPP